jgi:hypothetical protein
MLDSKLKVLLISPQHWGTMRVTKHHYAIELAKLGHVVFFLEPNEASWKWNQTSFEITPSDSAGVQLVKQQINVPYNLKFHLKGLFDCFIKNHIKKLEKQLGPFDLVWSFDLTNAMPLSYFSNKSKKIFFAADWPINSDAVNSAEGANLLVSVAQEILDQYPNHLNTKKLLIDHGVADCFIEEGKKPFVKTDDVIRIGMAGNFLRPDIDRLVLLEIIRKNKEFVFELFGAYNVENSNLGGSKDTETIEFIKVLQHAPNVILHGMVHPELLAKELRRMDAFLICYDVCKDQSKGTNYHKVMEYFAYGRPIVSNEISSYKTPLRQGLISMPCNEMSIIGVFNTVSNLLKTSVINQSSKMQELSRSNTYSINLLNVINACAEL